MLYLIRNKTKRRLLKALELMMQLDFDGDVLNILPLDKEVNKNNIKDLDSDSFVESNKKLFRDFKENVKY